MFLFHIIPYLPPNPKTQRTKVVNSNSENNLEVLDIKLNVQLAICIFNELTFESAKR